MFGMFGLLFSEEDKDLRDLKWNLHNAGYAQLGSHKAERYAHRIVLKRMMGRDFAKGELTDHINRNKLDNRRENLRVANKSINTINRGQDPRNTTGYKGVYLFHPKHYRDKGWAKRWSARVYRNGIEKTLGYFTTPEEAHSVREAYLANND